MSKPHTHAQGELTSQTMVAVIRAAVSAAVPERTLRPDASKTELLRMLSDAEGPSAVLRLGTDWFAQRPADNPVMAALMRGPTPDDVVRRWMKLERFGHTRNRTRVAGESAGKLQLHHVALDGSNIDALSDLFVWGLILALLKHAGFTDFEASLPQGEAAPMSVVRDGLPHLPRMPTQTTTLMLRWPPPSEERAEPPTPSSTSTADEGVVPRLRGLFTGDLMRAWRVAGAARRLCMSTRALQRSLTSAETTFSETLQRTRVDAAAELVSDTALSFTEIAYCTGFSDSAHLSRTFRRYLDVPPSALREVVG